MRGTGWAGLDEAKAFGLRLLELRGWRGLTLRETAGLAGLSFSFWGQVERGEKVVNSRKTLEAMAGALRVHPGELTEHPWAPRDAVGTETHAGLRAVEIALERYRLGVDPEVTLRPWPRIQGDIDRLVRLHHHVVDYTAAGELAAALIGELQSRLRAAAAAAPGGPARADRRPSGGDADREGSW